MTTQDYIIKTAERLSEIETELSNPATASNQKKYQQLVREHSSLSKRKQKADKYFNIQKDLAEHREIVNSTDADADLKELAQAEITELETALPAAEKDFKFALLPPDPDADRNAIVEVRAGTGGDEAALFAGDLFKMYARYAEIVGWKIGLIDASPGIVGGYKEVVFSVEGKGVYGALRYEMGGHRVQRIPTTESAGRIHTSAATVAVFPESEEDDDLEIDPADLRLDLFCSSGPGGQSVNTTYSAVRITHIPTGIAIQSQDERSQHRNKERAMKVLKARLLDLKRQEEEEKMGAERRSQIGSGDRSQRIRTYNFPQNRLTDHRINLTLYSLDRILEGSLGDLLSALYEHDMDLRLNKELATH